MQGKIFVCGRDEVLAKAGSVNPTHLLSMLDPTTPGYPGTSFTIPPRIQECLIIRKFHDIEYKHEFSPTQEQVNEILKWTYGILHHENHTLLINCEAGISRSTAIALSVMAQHGMPPSEAMKYLLKIRPLAHPNRLMLKYADWYLGFNGELIAIGEEIRNGHEFHHLLELAVEPTEEV